MYNCTINSFNYKGKTSLDFGLFIYEKNTFSAPARDVSLTTIPGRSGTLLIDNNRFENIDIKYSCNIIPELRFADFSEMSRNIKGWLLSEVGYFPLSDTYNKNYFRKAAYHSALDIEEWLTQLGKAPITFNCKPFLYSFAGQTAIKLTAPGNITNYEAFSSAPYIKITGSGNITLKINSASFLFKNVEGYIEVDSEIMNAFKGITPQNNKMSSGAFPSLNPGTNIITWTGNVSEVEIIPRWCAL